jgi:ketosteroid isomerase-like protein
MGWNDEQEIIRLFEDGDQALMSADVRELERIYAEDYTQSDESGRLSARADLIRDLTSGKIRFVAMKSTGRQVRLFGDFAVVHGSEEDEIEHDGKTVLVKYVYMDVVVRKGRRWQIVASQLAKL